MATKESSSDLNVENDLPLELIILSCGVCQATLPEVYATKESNRGFHSDSGGDNGVVTKLWIAECSHIMCGKHLPGGAAPFHPKGEQPRAPCLQCQERGDDGLKDLYGIRGLDKTEMDTAIPPEWLQCPAIKLDGTISGMEAVRFQYMNVARYAQRVTKYWKHSERQRHAMETSYSRQHKQRRHLQQEILELKARVEAMEGAEAKLRKWEARKPLIHHYLQAVNDMSSDIALMRSRLLQLGYDVPNRSYAFGSDSAAQKSGTSANDRPSKQGQHGRPQRSDLNGSAFADGLRRTVDYQPLYNRPAGPIVGNRYAGTCGIGAATCENLASKGCSLVINFTSDASADKAQKLADQLQTSYGVQCLPVQADMGNESGPAHLVDMARNRFSHPKTRKVQLDIIINNAGVASKSALEDCTSEEFARLYNVNVRGPLLLMKAAMPYLPHDRSGRVVNVSSVSSSLGFEEDGMYGGTKAALEAMTRTWARELSERCTVNAVNPGPVATDMYGATTREFQQKMSYWTRNTPLAAIRPEVDRADLVENAAVAGGRPAYDMEIAGVIAMLCTPDSSWCTGSVISANGGFKFSV
ncbi:hypothetical protein B0A55_09121 [Friedmanniomyces simplex]|uniref:Uncharacterized protein n=1 Tax=Friedmanniomyces simplex TaxID=329884 RepID=A0A4U0WQY9_9PEZI|nr:hypothetical protein B0A55_09121 [Friedmanniomyces simplex]